MTANSSLKGKTVVLTGGTGLLGSEFARACANCGANVIITGRNRQTGDALVRRIEHDSHHAEIHFEKCDITNLEDLSNLIDFVLQKYERIDALVNNAYPRNKNYGKKFEEVTFEDFCENLNAHLGGYFLTTREIAKIMVQQRSGNIVNIGSIYGSNAPKFELYEGTTMTMPVEYAVIKGGVINLTRYLASYLGQYNIRVNCISPGGVFNKQPAKFVKRYSQSVPLGKRMASTDDVTGVLVFLLSDASKYLTGQNIVVDGGWSI